MGTAHNPFAVAPVLGTYEVQEVVSNDMNGYALSADGTVTAWGFNTHGGRANGNTQSTMGANQIEGLSGVKQLATTAMSAAALLPDGTVWTWGSNHSGQLGSGPQEESSSIPVQVAGLTNVQNIATGNDAAYAILADGDLWGWGSSGTNQLGNDYALTGNVPLRIPGTAGVASIVPGYYASFAVLEDGSVISWGTSGYGMHADGQDTWQGAAPQPIAGLTGVTSMNTSIMGNFAVGVQP